jgi:hypothetical protein
LRKEAGFTPAFFLEDAEDVGRGPESGSRTGFAAGDRRAKKIKIWPVCNLSHQSAIMLLPVDGQRICVA